MKPHVIYSEPCFERLRSLGYSVEREGNRILSIEGDGLDDDELKDLFVGVCKPMAVEFDKPVRMVLDAREFTKVDTQTTVHVPDYVQLLELNQIEFYKAVKDRIQAGQLGVDSLRDLRQREAKGQNRTRVVSFLENRIEELTPSGTY